MPEAHLFGDRVSCLESDAPDIVREAVRILLHDGNALISVSFVDFCRMRGAHIMPLQEEHYVLDFLLFHPACLDPLDAELSDPIHLDQSVRIFFDDIQSLRTETLNDPLREFGSYSFDESGAKIFFNTINGGRKSFLIRFNRELPAEFCVHLPETGQRENRADMDLRHGTHNRHKVRMILHPDLDDRVTVLLILICNSFHYTAKMFHILLPLFFS